MCGQKLPISSILALMYSVFCGIRYSCPALQYSRTSTIFPTSLSSNVKDLRCLSSSTSPWHSKTPWLANSNIYCILDIKRHKAFTFKRKGQWLHYFENIFNVFDEWAAHGSLCSKLDSMIDTVNGYEPRSFKLEFYESTSIFSNIRKCSICHCTDQTCTIF